MGAKVRRRSPLNAQDTNVWRTRLGYRAVWMDNGARDP